MPLSYEMLFNVFQHNIGLCLQPMLFIFFIFQFIGWVNTATPQKNMNNFYYSKIIHFVLLREACLNSRRCITSSIYFSYLQVIIIIDKKFYFFYKMLSFFNKTTIPTTTASVSSTTPTSTLSIATNNTHLILLGRL